MKTDTVLGLAEAAKELGLPYQDAHRLLLTGELEGDKRCGRWWVTRASLDEFNARALARSRSQGSPSGR